MHFKIRKIPETNQDKIMNLIRYIISLPNKKTFICKKLHSRPNHIYFSEKTQMEIDSKLLDEIEKAILKEF